ncbi:HEPN domain-containing protein [Salipiger sp. PrR003]|uniref:HEPN domain-containing protein n=1 Tax=Salipiger sp. PrR003 TaxID=2706776 RepID=UPI0013DA9801|nr:HEPN domain-containing protein [Salipiger sp. PrR003]NDV51356.1 hypothetical protein [Salipiger sp. PrR003]
MQVIAENSETFILLNGISVRSEIQLEEGLLLQPADTSHIDFNTAISACAQPDDIAVVLAFIPRISSQFHISAPSPRVTAAKAWNSSWDALLLSAIFHTEIGFNIQSSNSAMDISSRSSLRAIHRYMSGFNESVPYTLTDSDTAWISRHFSSARTLLEDDRFQTAVQCLSTYHWHPNPRIKLAMIWAGIEGIFEVSSEIRFRISLYMARFLHPDNELERKETYHKVKKLYDVRSKAVHGAKLKGDLQVASTDSANLLNALITKCIETRSLPLEADLVP